MWFFKTIGNQGLLFKNGGETAADYINVLPS